MTTMNQRQELLRRLLNQNGGDISRMRQAIDAKAEERRRDPTVQISGSASDALDQQVAQCLDDISIGREIAFDWDDKAIDRGTHARRSPRVVISLETGATIDIKGSGHAHVRREIAIGTRDGYRQRLDAGSAMTFLAWRRMQASAIMAILDHVPSDPPVVRKGILTRIFHSRRTPPKAPGPGDHLADAVAKRIVDRAPIPTSSMTYLTDSSAYTGWRDGKPNIQTMKSDWLDIGDGVRMLRSGCIGHNVSTWVDHDMYMIAHPEWGVIYVPAKPILDALELRRGESFERALPRGNGPSLMAIISTNAAAAEVQRDCRKALMKDPNLTSRDGGRIDRLANEHLPRLVALHDEAVRTATPEGSRRLDDRLAEGIALARDALNDASTTDGNDAEEAFLAELRFLQMRHPSSKQ